LKEADALVPGNTAKDSYGLVSLLRGIALVQLKQPAEAITLLNTSLERQGNDSLADQGMYWLGEAYYQAGLYQASAGTLDKLVGRYPNSPYTADALYTIGWSYLRMKKFERASESFRNLVKAFPLTQYAAEAQARRGDALYLAGKYREAIEAYDEVRLANPSREVADHAAYQKGLAQGAIGEAVGALATLDVLVRCHPESELLNDALYAEGTMALAAGAYTRGSEVAREILMRNGGGAKDVPAYILMARAYAELGEKEKAAAIYSIIEAGHPGSDLASDAAGEIAKLRGDDEDERGDGESGGCGAYSRAGMALERGDIYLMLGHPVDALSEYRGVGEGAVAACRARALLGIGRAQAALGNGDAAADTLKMVLDASPGSSHAAQAAAELGTIYLSRRDTTGALALLDRWGTGGIDRGEGLEARRRIAGLYERLGRADSAMSLLYANARSGGSGWETAMAWIELAGLEGDSVRVDTVRRMLRAIPALQPELANEATIALARSLAMAGRTKDAADLLAPLNRDGQRDGAIDGEMALGLADANERAGSIDKAREWYRYVIDGCFGEEIRTRAAQRLEALKKL
jgi:TolA-binding protein